MSLRNNDDRSNLTITSTSPMFYDDHTEYDEDDWFEDETEEEDEDEQTCYTEEDEEEYDSYESEDIEEDGFDMGYDITPDYPSVQRRTSSAPTPILTPTEPRVFVSTRAPWINQITPKTSMADIMRQEQRKEQATVELPPRMIEPPVKKKVSLLRGNDLRSTDNKERHRLCKYGEKCHPSKRCELAQSLREWQPKTCRFRNCKQKVCHFRHETETNAQYLSRCLHNKTSFYYQNKDFYGRFLS